MTTETVNPVFWEFYSKEDVDRFITDIREQFKAGTVSEFYLKDPDSLDEIIKYAESGAFCKAMLLNDGQIITFQNEAFAFVGVGTLLGLALLGRNNPVGIAAAAVVWATIERATQRLGPIGVPPEIGRILQGSFLLAAVIGVGIEDWSSSITRFTVDLLQSRVSLSSVSE